MFPPLLTKAIIDIALPEKDFSYLLLFATILIAIPCIICAIIIWDLYLSSYILKIGAKVRTDIYNGVQNKDIAWHKATKIGDVINRAINETGNITNFAYRGIDSLVWIISSIITGLVILSLLNIWLAVVIVFFLTLNYIITKYIGKKISHTGKQDAVKEAEIFNKVRESLDGIEYIKITGKEEKLFFNISNLLNEQRKIYENINHQNMKVELIRGVTTSLLLGVLYYIGGILVLNEQITIGTLVAAISIYFWFLPSIGTFQSLYTSAKRVMPLVERVKEILFPVKKQEHTNFPESKYALKVNNLNYSIGSKNIINGLSLNISSGEVVALVGFSGSGKSTLIDILLGFVDKMNYEGTIKYGSIPIEEISNGWIRKKISVVTQNTSLRSGSLKQNLTYFLPEDIHPNDREIYEVIKIVGLQDWLELHNEGLDLNLGERGKTLSGGEAQRLSIARSLLLNPDILFLDEATSALDSKTESFVLNNIRSLYPNMSVIIITHRIQSIRDIERILVMREGRIVEEGTHDQLVDMNGVYANLYNSQKNI
jgi:ABC-type multidrug transport system fused ATPase/permease subunit